MTDKEFEKINERLKSLTPEQIKRNILCLNGKITKEIVEEVLNKVDETSFVDDSTAYILGRDFEECFQDLFKYVDIKYDSFKVDCTNNFEQYQTYFSYNDKKFVVSVMIGQGSYIYFQKIDDFEDYPNFELEIDEEFKFYKKIDN
jgi:hypothetical protein